MRSASFDDLDGFFWLLDRYLLDYCSILSVGGAAPAEKGPGDAASVTKEGLAGEQLFHLLWRVLSFSEGFPHISQKCTTSLFEDLELTLSLRLQKVPMTLRR